MGRPIKDKFFGNRNLPYYGSEQLGSGVGGEGVSAITVTNGGTYYSKGTTLSIGAPQIAGGTQATFSYSIGAPGVGDISVTLTNGGSGYTSAPTLTVTKATTVASTTNSGLTATNTLTVSSTAGIAIGMLISGGGTGSSGYVTAINGNIITTSVPNNVAWTDAGNLQFIDNGSSFAKTITMTGRQNAIKFASYLTTGSGIIQNGDIVKQEGSHAYLVKNSEGTGICRLATTSTLAAGQMNIVATDTNGSTYYVKKLTAHKVVLVQSTLTGSFVFGNNSVAGWTFGSASTGVVSIANG